jgi:hypothetical protein
MTLNFEGGAPATVVAEKEPFTGKGLCNEILLTATWEIVFPEPVWLTT